MTSLTLSAVTEPDGTVVGYIGAGEDITERLRVQDALITALDREHASVLRLEEVDHVKQELVSNVSHELRTPITSISGYAELLSDGSLGELNDRPDRRHRTHRAQHRRASACSSRTCSRSRRPSRASSSSTTPRSTCATSSAKDASCSRSSCGCGRSTSASSCRPEPVLIQGDARGPRTGGDEPAEQRDQVHARRGPGHGLADADRGGRLDVVTDTGMGISEEDQEHLFTRFFRATAATEQAIQGTGLGLSIVHSIVTQHGGAVSIDSARGRGTTVDRAAAPGWTPVAAPYAEPAVRQST